MSSGPQKGDLIIRFTPMVFPNHSYSRGGELPDVEMGAQACWQYYLYADKALKEWQKPIEFQTTRYEGEEWATLHLVQMKRSVAMMYGVTPDRLDRFWEAVRAEAKRCGMPEPDPRIIRANPLDERDGL